MREEQPKRDDHHKRAATISNTKIQMINTKRQLLFEMQNKRLGNYILIQQEITGRGCKPLILEM
jgi:hypothetical protein